MELPPWLVLPSDHNPLKPFLSTLPSSSSSSSVVDLFFSAFLPGSCCGLLFLLMSSEAALLVLSEGCTFVRIQRFPVQPAAPPPSPRQDAVVLVASGSSVSCK